MHQVSLSWTAPTQRADGTPISGVITYNLFRNNSTSPLNAAPLSATTYQDTTVVGGVNYSYNAVALEAGNATPSSSTPNVAANIPLAAPNAPAALTVTSSN